MNWTPNKTPFHYSLGLQGEEIAHRYLLGQGYEILTRNFRCPIGEIDLVAKRGERYFFIEIKARSSSRFGSPQEAVTRQKQAKLIRLAQWYLKQHRLADAAFSFDVIAVMFSSEGEPKISHIQNAFEAKAVYEGANG